MKILTLFKERIHGLLESIARFPLTVIMLVAAATLNALNIELTYDYFPYVATCLIGAIASAVSQITYERFFVNKLSRIILMGISLVVSGLYYLSIMNLVTGSWKFALIFVITAFSLAISFVWIAVIKNKYTFNDSFMATFKSFVQSLFFSGVLMGGCSLIIAAIDRLIVRVPDNSFSHTANIIFFIFATILFLSLIPVYPGKKDKNLSEELAVLKSEKVEKRISCPKFFEILLSYIIIPLSSVFTLILVLYIALNIKDNFWVNNLLEPMLVSYSIVIILVSILVSNIKNKFATFFLKIFPKVLVPIVAFQIVSSILKIGEEGITYGRYYAIIYGVFAIIAGLILSIFKERKNGYIAMFLIIFSLISILPPIDVFSVSRSSQVSILKKTLEKNNMFVNNEIIPNPNISSDDQTKILNAYNNLVDMDEINSVSWIPKRSDAYDTFGFNDNRYDPYNYVKVYLDENIYNIPITGNDILINTTLQLNDIDIENTIANVQFNDKEYILKMTTFNGENKVIMYQNNNSKVIEVDVNQILESIQEKSYNKNLITIDDAVYKTENENVAITVVIKDASFSIDDNDFTNAYISAYLLIDFKN